MGLARGFGKVVWASALAGAGAAIGYVALRTEEGRATDEDLFKILNAPHGPAVDRSLAGITELGSMYAAAAAAGALALAGRRREGARALAGAGATWLLLQGAKRLVERPRPFTADPEGTRQLIAEPQGTSWPSSHPAVLTTFSRIAARELGLGRLSRLGLTGVDASVGTSRVALGVHYPSDVASGLLFGRAVARLWPRGRSQGRR
jgi:membrane-associated phospholipid phosphatase